MQKAPREEKKNFFVYMFLDVNQESIYVGQTKNLTGRIRSTHFAGGGHLPDACYNEAVMVVYSQCLSESDMSLQERYLINTLKPKYNEKLNRGDSFSFTIDCFKWKYLPFVRPEERPEKSKRKASTAIVASSLPDTFVEMKSMAVPSLAHIGPLPTTRDDPGEPYPVFSFGDGFTPLRGIRMNDEVWLSALSISQFCFADDNDSKIRMIQFINKGFIGCGDVCVVQNGTFRRRDFKGSRLGQYSEFMSNISNGILVKATALKGVVEGILERRTRGIRKRFEKGSTIIAYCHQQDGRLPEKKCKTLEEYYDWMAGAKKTNANLFAISHHLPRISWTLSRIGKSEP